MIFRTWSLSAMPTTGFCTKQTLYYAPVMAHSLIWLTSRLALTSLQKVKCMWSTSSECIGPQAIQFTGVGDIPWRKSNQ